VQQEEADAESAYAECHELEDLIYRQNSVQNELQTASLKRRAHVLQEQISEGNLDPEEEARLRAKLSQLTQTIERKSEEIETAQRNSILNYKEAFKKIIAHAEKQKYGSELQPSARSQKSSRKKTHISDVAGVEGTRLSLDQVVSSYVANYDEAFNLLNYVQRVQEENYKLEAQLASVRIEFHKYSKEQSQQDMSKERIKKELEGQLENLSTANLKLQKEVDSKEATLGALVQSVARLAQRFNESNSMAEITELDELEQKTAGDEEKTASVNKQTLETTGHALMQALGQVEERTVEMCKSLHKRMRSKRGLKQLTQNTKGARSSGSLVIADPNLNAGELFGVPNIALRSRDNIELSIPDLSEEETIAMFGPPPDIHLKAVDEYSSATRSQDDASPEEEDDSLKILSTQSLRAMVMKSSQIGR